MRTEIINSILRKHKCKKLYYRLTEHYKNKLFAILSNINKVEGDRNEIFHKIFYDYRLNKEVTKEDLEKYELLTYKELGFNFRNFITVNIIKHLFVNTYNIFGYSINLIAVIDKIIQDLHTHLRNRRVLLKLSNIVIDSFDVEKIKSTLYKYLFLKKENIRNLLFSDDMLSGADYKTQAFFSLNSHLSNQHIYTRNVYYDSILMLNAIEKDINESIEYEKSLNTIELNKTINEIKEKLNFNAYKEDEQTIKEALHIKYIYNILDILNGDMARFEFKLEVYPFDIFYYDIEGNKIFDYYITKNLTNKLLIKTN